MSGSPPATRSQTASTSTAAVSRTGTTAAPWADRVTRASSGTKKPPASGITTNSGTACSTAYPFRFRIRLVSNVPYFSYSRIASATTRAVTLRPMTMLVSTRA